MRSVISVKRALGEVHASGGPYAVRGLKRPSKERWLDDRGEPLFLGVVYQRLRTNDVQHGDTF